MFEQTKKKYRKQIRKSLAKFLPVAGVLATYAGTQINETINRYKVKESTYSTEHFRLVRQEGNMDTRSTKQRSYRFAIEDLQSSTPFGYVTLLLGQEKDSYYGGHIRLEADNLTITQRKEIYEAAIAIARQHMMSKLYFVASAKDKDSIAFYESLGVQFRKTILIPQDSPYYVPKKNKVNQYVLDLVDEKTKQKMDDFKKTFASRHKKKK